MQSPTSPAMGLPFFSFFIFLLQSCPTQEETQGRKSFQRSPLFLSNKQERVLLTVREGGRSSGFCFPSFQSLAQARLWQRRREGGWGRFLTLQGRGSALRWANLVLICKSKIIEIKGDLNQATLTNATLNSLIQLESVCSARSHFYHFVSNVKQYHLAERSFLLNGCDSTLLV